MCVCVCVVGGEHTRDAQRVELGVDLLGCSPTYDLLYIYVYVCVYIYTYTYIHTRTEKERERERERDAPPPLALPSQTVGAQSQTADLRPPCPRA